MRLTRQNPGLGARALRPWARARPASQVLAGNRPADAKPQFSRIDELVREAMAAKLTPGAVVLVGRGDQTVYEKAFGFRATVPAEEPMTLDTVFDLASLTKVVATTTAVMTLVEQGRLRLNDTGGDTHPGVRALRKRRHHRSAIC